MRIRRGKGEVNVGLYELLVEDLYRYVNIMPDEFLH